MILKVVDGTSGIGLLIFQTGSNGANLSFPAEFGIDNGTQRDAWIVGLVNAIIFLTAGLM